MSNVDINEIFRLRDEDHLVDNIVEIELDTKKKPRVQETDKRNLLIQDAEDHGCSHVLVIDSDEYYTRKSFEYGLQQIDEHDYEITYCQYVNYYHDYNHYLKYPFEKGMYVPWVTKTCYRHHFDCQDFKKPSDPTRRYVTHEKWLNGQPVKLSKPAEYHEFEWNEVKMHHFSWIRADIRKKLNSWSSKTIFKDFEDIIDKAVNVFNRFDENSDKNEPAVLLFNTPDNKVDVVKFPKQFIHPPFDINTRLRPAKDYKKLLFLSMSADLEPFNTLEKVCNETWRNVDHEKYPNINAEFWTYTDAPEGEDTYLDRNAHIIYIKRDWWGDKKDHGLNSTYSKTVEALKIINDYLKLDYDYLIRTNNSTWLNVPLINEFLAYQDDDSLWFGGCLYSAFFSAFNPYMGGQLMIWSRRNASVVDRITGNVAAAKAYERKYVACDDNMLGSRINDRNIRLGLYYEDVFHSLGGVDLYEKTVPDTLDWSCVSYQVKTFGISLEERLSLDPDKMRKVDEMWRNCNEDIDTLYKKMMSDWYDKYFTVIPYSKVEWFKDGNSQKVAQCRSQYQVTREEAFAQLPALQKKNGYMSGKYKRNS